MSSRAASVLRKAKHEKVLKASLKAAGPPGKSYTCGCLFAAIGGFTRAMQSVGVAPLWANEKDIAATTTFAANFPEVRLLHKPIEELAVRGDRLEPVDILTAGFPCQPFSVAGEKRGFSDERGLLFLHIIRILKEFGRKKPKILLLENVRYFRSHDDGRTFKRVQTEIQKAGYWFGESDAQVLNTATHTDIPQNRERVFMVALNTEFFPRNSFRFPERLPNKKLRSVWEFIDHHRKQDQWYYFQPTSQYYDLFRKAIETNGPKAIYQLRRNYVRDNKSGVCFTLMANMGEGGHNQPVIKDRWGIRKLTPRECARLQGFEDDWFVIPESLSRYQTYKQIGNSVTIPLVEKLARACVAELATLRSR